MRILLVEDTDDLRQLFARVLKGLGCEVVEAADGPSALGAVEAFAPDLVITDVMMPGMDGVELIGRLRTMPRLASVPMVAITADVSWEAERRALAAGADDCLVKPVDLGLLLDRVERLGGA